MFLILPVGTDAPVYHRPFATVGLIVANLIAFVLTAGGQPDRFEAWEAWRLEFGNGLHPLQWLLCHFLHFGVAHLFGNMVFLWGFGLVVEGKIGSLRFLALWMAIGVVGALLMQAAFLAYDGPVIGAGGASLCVSGVMAVCLVWAPRNDVTVWYAVWVLIVARAGTFELSILVFSILFVLMDLVFVGLHAGQEGFSPAGELAHIAGTVVGFALGAILLKRGLVDCEGWDLFTWLRGDSGRTDHLLGSGDGSAVAARRTRAADGDCPAPARRRTADPEAAAKTKTLTRIRDLLREGKARAAHTEYRKLQRLLPDWQLPAEDTTALLEGLHAAGAWEEAIPLYEECIRRNPQGDRPLRMRLAKLLVERERPAYALHVLEPIDVSKLPPEVRPAYRRISAAARQAIDEGTIELQRDWAL